MADYGVLDIECDGDPWTGKLLCVGWRDKAYPVDAEGFTSGADADAMWDELADPEIIKVVFTKYDHRWLRLAGYEINGPIHDVQTMAWTVDERTDLDLEFVSIRYGEEIVKDKRLKTLGGKVFFRRDDGDLVPIADAPTDQLLRYNYQDLLATANVYERLTKRLQEQDLYDYWLKMQVPFTPVLVDMEVRGIPINVFQTKVAAVDLRKQIEMKEIALKAIGGLPDDFNLASGLQLMSYLFQKTFTYATRIKLTKDEVDLVKLGFGESFIPHGFEVTKIGREYIYGQYILAGRGLKAVAKAPKCKEKLCSHKTNAEHLPSVSTKTLKVFHGDDPWVAKLIEYKAIVKGLQFLDTWIEEEHDGRIYARFNQTGTVTGRLSSSGPNLQQVPSHGEIGKRFRRLFRPEPGKVFIHGDYSQLEPRLMAHWSQDPVLLDIFRTGKDIYLETAQALGIGTRDLMKVYVLAMGYGAQAKKLRMLLAESGFFLPLHTVSKTLEGLQELYVRYFDWKDEMVAVAEDQRYVETLAGHRRHVTFTDDTRWKTERQVSNSIIQGSAADIVQSTMILIDQDLPMLDIVAQVHDELLMEADAALFDDTLWYGDAETVIEHVQNIAERVHGYDLTVPLVFEPKFISDWSGGKG